MRKKRSKQGSSRGVTPQFYRGRTTVNVDSADKIRKQKEYRRKKLSQQKRTQLISHVMKWGRVVIVALLLIVLLGQLRITSASFEDVSGGSVQAADIAALP